MWFVDKDGNMQLVSKAEYMVNIEGNDPQSMKHEIFELAEECINEVRDGIFKEPDKSELLEQGIICRNIIFFTNVKKVNKNGKEGFILKGYVGSPLYIALRLKYYEEAEMILDKNPDTAFPGYAALPLVLTYDEDENSYPTAITKAANIFKDPNYVGFPNCEFLVDKGIYLQETTYTDKHIPESLFLKLCDALSRRNKSLIDKPLTLLDEEFNLPTFMRKGKTIIQTNDDCDIPILALDFPDKFDVIKYPDVLDTQLKKEKALENYKCFVALFDGLYRLKKLDNDLFDKIFCETTAYWIFILYYQKIACILNEIAKETDIYDIEVGKDFHMTEIKEDIDTEEEFEKIRNKFNRLGIKTLSPDVLWQTMDAARKKIRITAVRRYNVNSYVFYDVYKAVFKEKLVFEFKDDGEFNIKDTSKLAIILGLNGDATWNFYWKDNDKVCLIEWLVDHINWKNEDVIKKERRDMEKAVIQMKDKEFFLSCLEKNIFPIWDVDYMAECIETDSDEYKDYLPLLLLKKYGRFE